MSATESYNTTVLQAAVYDTNFGECMAQLKDSPSSQGLDCKPGWVTFSCSGDFNSKSAGNNKLTAAQIALLSGDLVNVQVTDEKKHNGYCFARKIANLKLSN
ncbi:MAG: hypothetical protein HOC23_23730 [Halieaceae bacterium]|nr:hypothetical protein [Halieaceae bacterium]